MLKENDLRELLLCYDKPIPRYTSYPTVPFWNFETLTVDAWKDSVRSRFENENGEICLYIHLPFCEELCTYCACNKRITKNHGVETPYLQSILKEWDLYREIFGQKPAIQEIHLGGGTPTFFSPENLKTMMLGLLENSDLGQDVEFSVEVHPNYTKKEHLEALRSVGFNRISLGVQDFDPKVQYIINRIQTFDQTRQVVDWARDLGYESVNFDLIYGLPLQTESSIHQTMENVARMMPDRIAFYSYAHVPWKSKGQRRYSDEDVPKGEEKIKMFLLGTRLLNDLGYINIGMDHFSLPDDKLVKAFSQGKLHRNFMGYTTTNHALLVGLGASSISDTWDAMAQNDKTVEDYQQKIEAGQLPIVHGHALSDHDQLIRQQILNIMCRLETDLENSGLEQVEVALILEDLKKLENNGMVSIYETHVQVTETGKIFLRNIAACMDPSLRKTEAKTGLFSRSV